MLYTRYVNYNFVALISDVTFSTQLPNIFRANLLTYLTTTLVYRTNVRSTVTIHFVHEVSEASYRRRDDDVDVLTEKLYSEVGVCTRNLNLTFCS